QRPHLSQCSELQRTALPAWKAALPARTPALAARTRSAVDRRTGRRSTGPAVPSHPATIAGTRSRARIVVLGGVVLGTTDLLFACTFAGLYSHASPVRVFQSVARGVLGDASYDGGAGSAVLGVVLHYVIATTM